MILGAFVCIFIFQPHIASRLIKLEFISMTLVAAIVAALSGGFVVFNLIFLTFVLIVIEAALGLSVLIFFSRQSNKELLSTFV